MKCLLTSKRRATHRASTARPARPTRPRVISEETWTLIAELNDTPNPVIRELSVKVARGDLIHGRAF